MRGRCTLSPPDSGAMQPTHTDTRDGDCPQIIHFYPMIEILTENKGNLAFHVIKYSSNNKKIKANTEKASFVSGPPLSVLHILIFNLYHKPQETTILQSTL